MDRLGLPQLTSRQRRALAVNVCLEVTGEYGTLLSSLSLAAVERSLHLDHSELALIASVTSLAGVLGCVWALMTDVYGRRLFFRIGLPLAAAGEILNGLTFSGYSLMLVGAFKALSPPAPGLTYLIEELGPQDRGAISALVATGAGAGAGIALGLWAVIGGYSWGWRVMALLQCVPVLYMSIRIWCSTEDFIPESLCFAPPKKGGLAAFKRPLHSLFMEPRNRKVLLLWCMYMLVFNLLHCALGQFLYVHLVDDCGYSAQHNSLLTLVGGMVALPMVFLTGKVSDRIGRVPTTQLVWFLGGVSYALFYGAPCGSPWLPVGFILVVVFPQFCRIALSRNVASELWQTEHRCLASAVSDVVNSVAGSIGFALFPVLAERVGGSRRALAVLGLACSIALPLAVYLVPETSGVKMNNLNQPEPNEEGSDQPSISLQDLDQLEAKPGVTGAISESISVTDPEAHVTKKSDKLQYYGSLDCREQD